MGYLTKWIEIVGLFGWVALATALFPLAGLRSGIKSWVLATFLVCVILTVTAKNILALPRIDFSQLMKKQETKNEFYESLFDYAQRVDGPLVVNYAHYAWPCGVGVINYLDYKRLTFYIDDHRAFGRRFDKDKAKTIYGEIFVTNEKFDPSIQEIENIANGKCETLEGPNSDGFVYYLKPYLSKRIPDLRQDIAVLDVGQGDDNTEIKLYSKKAGFADIEMSLVQENDSPGGTIRQIKFRSLIKEGLNIVPFRALTSATTMKGRMNSQDIKINEIRVVYLANDPVYIEQHLFRGDTKVIDAVNIIGMPRLAVDKFIPDEGSSWNCHGCLVFADTSSSITVESPDVPVQGLVVSADNNDKYQLFCSTDGTEFSELGIIPVHPKQGMRNRNFLSDSLSMCRYIKVSPLSGDGSYSIGEVGFLLSGYGY